MHKGIFHQPTSRRGPWAYGGGGDHVVLVKGPPEVAVVGNMLQLDTDSMDDEVEEG